MTTLIILVLAGIAALCLYVATMPAAFSVERSTTVKAAPDRVFALINDLHAMNIWNPFAQTDPALQLTYSGSDSGVGAAYNWAGPKAGQGRMEIISALAPTSVSLKLDFSKPFVAHNLVDFTMQAKGSETSVTWRMHGNRNFMMKLIGLFFSMDSMVGGEFEKGLASLKTLAEKR